MKNTLAWAVGIIIGVSIMIPNADAKTKSNPVVEASIPFAFQLANRTLPAGNYKFELATGVPGPSDRIGVIIVDNPEAGIYQALAVSIKPDAGLENESSVEFSSDRHLLIAMWQQGNRLELQPAAAATIENADEWSDGEELVTIASRTIEQ
jgi:hypothetical protein